MRAWPILVLTLASAMPAAAETLPLEPVPEIAQMRGPGFGCAAPFLLHAAEEAPRQVAVGEPPPLRRAMLTCLATPGNPKRPLHRT
jgi:hypothetical protein